MRHSPEELEQKIRGMLFLTLKVVNWEKVSYNPGANGGQNKKHLIESIQALAGDIYNDREHLDENSNT
tara:strand:- start:4683 stop:4886 length:204 start_codon:yes stop_codon:yes gene_type:complete